MNISAAELRQKRMARIAAMTEKVEAKVEPVVASDSRSYDPMTQKPTKLDEVPRRQGYTGPQPDAGYAYGEFGCDACNTTMQLQDGAEMYCPGCGGKVKKLSDVKAEVIIAFAKDTQTHVCPACKEKIISAETPKACPQCGTVWPGVTEVSSTKKCEKCDKEPCVCEEKVPMQDRMEKSVIAAGGKSVTMPVDTIHGADGASVEMLADFDDLVSKEITIADVNLTLYDDQTNPHWNVDVFGQPAIAIYLGDQPRQEEISKLFRTEKYGVNVAQAIAEYGLDELCKTTKARPFATKLNKSKLATEIRAEVEKELKAKYAKATADMAQDWKNACKIAIAGINKNAWPDADNSLQICLYNKLEERKVPNPEALIIAAFEESSDPYFDAVTAKAEYLMNLTPEALAETVKIITNSSLSSNVAASTAGDDDIPIVQRMTDGNFPIQASSLTALTGVESTRQVAYRNKLHIGGTR